jgi:hypothetical protein
MELAPDRRGPAADAIRRTAAQVTFEQERQRWVIKARKTKAGKNSRRRLSALRRKSERPNKRRRIDHPADGR